MSAFRAFGVIFSMYGYAFQSILAGWFVIEKRGIDTTAIVFLGAIFVWGAIICAMSIEGFIAHDLRRQAKKEYLKTHKHKGE